MGNLADSGPSELLPLDEPSITSADAFAELSAAFGAAQAASPALLREADYVVGGRRVKTRVLGAELAQVLARGLLPGSGAGAPKLSFDLWDCAETGQAAPTAASGDDADERHGSGGERFAISPDQRYARYSGPGFAVRHGRLEQRAVGWVSSHTRLSVWNRARPWQLLLVPWLGHDGARVLHAALVGRDGRAILVVGPNRTGKSTTSGACIEAGFEFLGDDAIAVERAPDTSLVGHCLYPVIKLDRALAGSFPLLASDATTYDDPDTDEIITPVSLTHPDAVVPTSRIVALALPRLSASPQSRLVGIGRGEALRVLTGAVTSVASGRLASDFEFLCGVIETTPAFRIEVGREPRRIPPVIAELLDRVDA